MGTAQCKEPALCSEIRKGQKVTFERLLRFRSCLGTKQREWKQELFLCVQKKPRRFGIRKLYLCFSVAGPAGDRDAPSATQTASRGAGRTQRLHCEPDQQSLPAGQNPQILSCSLFSLAEPAKKKEKIIITQKKKKARCLQSLYDIYPFVGLAGNTALTNP